jgi:hypothetical protein
MSIITPITEGALAANLQKIAPELDRALVAAHGRQVGFAVILFEFGPLTTLSYVSNAERDGLIRTMREWLDRLERGQVAAPVDFTKGPRG